jgi:hypothetical protein
MAILGTQVTSTLSTKGETQNNLDKLQQSTAPIDSLKTSKLDLDGKTPSKYVDNLPK